MTNEDLAQGRYLAQVEEWKIDESKNKKTLQITVKFNVAGSHVYYWTGSLEGSDKAKEITAKALRAMGFTSNNPEDLLLDNALDTQKEVNVTLEYEMYEGKTYPKIKWVNEVSDGMQGMEFESASRRLKSIDLKAFLMAQPSGNNEAGQDLPF